MSDSQPGEIFIPLADEWKGFPHGQMVFDRPGHIANFAATHDEINAGVWAEKIADFVESGEPFLAFREPHFGQMAFLSRIAAERIYLIQCAKSAKIVPEAKHGTTLRDAETRAALPVLRRSS